MRCHEAPLPEQIASSKFIHADSCQISQESERTTAVIPTSGVAKMGVTWANSDEFT